MSKHEGTLIEKISFLTDDQQELVLKFVEDIEAKEPSTEMKILIQFEPFVTRVIAQHPDRPNYDWGSGSSADPIDILVAYIKEQHHFLVNRMTIDRALYDIGSITAMSPETSFNIKGRNIDSGLPSSFDLTSVEVREQIAQQMEYQIRNAALNIKLLPKNMNLSDDVLIGATVRLRGQYAGLRGLAEAVHQATGLTVVD